MKHLLLSHIGMILMFVPLVVRGDDVAATCPGRDKTVIEGGYRNAMLVHLC